MNIDWIKFDPNNLPSPFKPYLVTCGKFHDVLLFPDKDWSIMDQYGFKVMGKVTHYVEITLPK